MKFESSANWLWIFSNRSWICLPKEKTASLESLLDAATLAIHFSKARNAQRCEVIYTTAKNVRKPKGLPPGKVTAAHTKSLDVEVSPERLQRLLASRQGNDAD